MNQTRDYSEVVELIQNKRRFGNLTGCEITKIILEQLGYPQGEIPVIHVAGTNGKGSVSAFLCEILKRAGQKVGMFTSPHLIDFRERIRINDEMITEAEVERLGNLLLDADFGVAPTMFDYCLAMALLYFKEQKCSVIVLETGLGGRYDSTNAVACPKVSVITKIGLDHMAILGNTMEEIAAEKAGIMKAGTKVICESQSSEVEAIFLKEAQEAGAESIQIIDWEKIRITGQGKFDSYGYKDLKIQMLGMHQYENATAALLAAEAFLQECPKEQQEQAIREGLYATRWMGRMEVLSEAPFFMVDGAHNAHGVSALRESLVRLFPGERFHFIMGVMADKDYMDMIEELLELAYDFTTVTVAYNRSLGAEELAECIRERGVSAKEASLEDALLQMQKCKDSGEKTIAFGSLYFIGEIETIYKMGKNT